MNVFSLIFIQGSYTRSFKVFVNDTRYRLRFLFYILISNYSSILCWEYHSFSTEFSLNLCWSSSVWWSCRLGNRTGRVRCHGTQSGLAWVASSWCSASTWCHGTVCWCCFHRQSVHGRNGQLAFLSQGWRPTLMHKSRETASPLGDRPGSSW